MHFVVMNQLNHQEIVIDNLYQLTSNHHTLPPKTIPVVLSIMGRLNYHAVDNGDVEVYTSDYPLESTSVYVTYTDNNSIKSVYDDEMYHIPELFH